MVVQVPTPPKFVQHLNNVVTEEGSQVILEGIVSGKPMPTISWFRKSTPLSDSPDLRLEYRPDGTVKLTLKEVIDLYGPKMRSCKKLGYIGSFKREIST